MTFKTLCESLDTENTCWGQQQVTNQHKNNSADVLWVSGDHGCCEGSSYTVWLVSFQTMYQTTKYHHSNKIWGEVFYDL